MKPYSHSVYLDETKCNGCTTCLRHCPTEAIRIRNGRAVINGERCIDCGECIRSCPQKAKRAACGSLDRMKDFKWNIALPSPSLYGQFENLDDIDYVLGGLKRIGFGDVFEVSAAAELISAYTRVYMEDPSHKRPVISSACPVILRLIQLRFPSLTDHIMQLMPPMELAAHLAREKALKEHPALKSSDIGVFFISPCPAKVSYVSNGFADYKSEIDVVVSNREIYFLLIGAIRSDSHIDSLSDSGMIGIGWASTGGEATAILNERYLAADGIENCIRVLDQIEDGSIPNLEFVELNACAGGCVGGVLNIQNPFIAKARLQGLRRYLPVSCNFLSDEEKKAIPEKYLLKEFPSYRPISKLSDNISDSMRMMGEIGRLRETLPGIDCGSCGAPTCRAFAEDVVRGQITVGACPILAFRNKPEQDGETN